MPWAITLTAKPANCIEERNNNGQNYRRANHIAARRNCRRNIIISVTSPCTIRRGKAAHLVITSRLTPRHRAGRVADRRADLGAQPTGGARSCRYLRNGLSERGPLAVVLPAPPACLGPPHHNP